MIRKQMIRLAFVTTDSELRSDLLRILTAESKGMQPLDVEEEETETQKKKKGPHPHWDEFLKAKYDGGKKKIPNTNPKTKGRFHQVTMQTLFKSDEGFKKRVMKEYSDWMKGQSDTDKKAPSPEKGKKPSPKKKGVTFPTHDLKPSQFYANSYGLDIIKELLGIEATRDDLLNLVGGGFTFGATTNVSIYASSLQISGPHISTCSRILKKDSKTGKPYLYMDVLRLYDSAPKGTGTRMFASSVFQAQKLGIQHIRCQAFRSRSSPEWVGYKVWPKMGYDGVLPLEEYGSEHAYSEQYCPPLPKKIKKSLEEAGFETPYRLSHLHMVDGGQEWWEKKGQSFHAEFDTTPGSHSMQVIEAYLKKCMERDGETDLNAWLQKKS